MCIIFILFLPVIWNVEADLLEHRDGCVICMDYSDYNKNYVYLIAYFGPIANILKDELIRLRDKGIRLSNTYMFGFSYGARLIVRAGSEIGYKSLGIIHRSYL